MLNAPKLTSTIEWLKKNKYFVILFLIILFGAYLRLNNFSELARFNADQVRDAKIVDAMVENKEFPLLGPKAGGTTFKLGPAFYYLQYISGMLFGFTPAGIALFIPLLSTASIFLFYLLFKNLFSIRITLALTLLYASSFYLLKYSRFAWNPNAIPFFLLAFLNLSLAIALKKRSLAYHLALGALVGIGVQLHTTLLILLPTFTFGLYAYLFIQNKKLPLQKIAAAFLTVLFLNAPFIFSDFSNKGENLRSFFSGAQTKTESGSSLWGNLKNVSSFVVQGSVYTLTGFEPQKDWSKPLKLVRSKSWPEISFCFAGFLLVFFGAYLTFLKFKTKQNKAKKLALAFLIAISAASLLLFTIIGEELNLRFFIILIFLPFLFLGFILEFFIHLFKKHHSLFIFLGAIFLLAILIFNLAKYSRVYDLENYQEKESAYGGISLKESQEISRFMLESIQKNPNKKAYSLSYEFKRSVDYFNSKAKISVTSYKENELPDEFIVFLIAEKQKADSSLQKIDDQFNLLEQKNSGRFTIFLLLPKNITHRVGFITDIHGVLQKKYSYNFNFETRNALAFFNSKMNEEFKPSLVVQGGDFIDGTNRKGQKSIDDFKALKEIFPTFQCHNMTSWEIMI